MSDTIRWCYTHSDVAYKWADYCRDEQGNAIDCDISDALVIRADTPVYRIVEVPFPDRVHIGSKLTGWQDPPTVVAALVDDGVLVRIQGGDDE